MSDRFGDAGLTGILGLELNERDRAVISDLILSCRVMGRKVEETLLHVATTLAGQAGKALVEAHFIPTAKNRPCLDFLQRSGLEEADKDTFIWHTARPYDRPATLELVMGGPEA